MELLKYGGGISWGSKHKCGHQKALSCLSAEVALHFGSLLSSFSEEHYSYCNFLSQFAVPFLPDASLTVSFAV